MALTGSACGWAAAGAVKGAPLAVVGAVAWLLASAERLRSFRAAPSVRGLALALAMSFPPALALAALSSLWAGNEAWTAAVALPWIFYGGLLLAGLERLPLARLVGVAALTSTAPATYAAASGSFGPIAAMLWLALGGYFMLDALFVMARLRGSRGMLWAVRAGASAVAAGTLMGVLQSLHHVPIVVVFGVLAARAWIHPADAPRPDPRRAGIRKNRNWPSARRFLRII
jgi:hypothetical protein